MSKKIEQLNIAELKSGLIDAAKQSQEEMAPLLYYLRAKLKARGQVGKGFGAWVQDNLVITRRTADTWANDWAISQGLKKTPAAKTSGKISRSSLAEPITISSGPRKVCCNLSIWITEAAQEALLFTWGRLGEEAATQFLLDSFAQAEKESSQRLQPDPFAVELGELAGIGVKKQSDSVGAVTSIVKFAEGEPR